MAAEDIFPAPSAPPLPQGDEDAAAVAANARDHGTALIRDHLNAHLAQNPKSSYVSWIATLHPENAKVDIDPRFLLPGNPWLAVYEEGADFRVTPSSPPSDNDAVVDPSFGETITKSPGVVKEGKNTQRNAYGGIIDLAFGAAFLLTAVAVTFAIDLISIYCYLSSVLCWRIASRCSSPRVTLLSALPFGICHLLYQVLRLVDFILLFLSVFVVEMIAAFAAVTCAMLSLRCDVGSTVHQRTRRLAHLTRWAFRHPFEDCLPVRTYDGRGSFARGSNCDRIDNPDIPEKHEEAKHTIGDARE